MGPLFLSLLLPWGGAELQVDAVEDGWVRLTGEGTQNTLILPRQALPARIKEGDVLLNGELAGERRTFWQQAVRQERSRLTGKREE